MSVGGQNSISAKVNINRAGVLKGPKQLGTDLLTAGKETGVSQSSR